MLIDITPQEMRAICAGLDLLQEYFEADKRSAEQHQKATVSLQKKALYLADQSKQMHTAIMDRAEAL